MRKLLFLLLSTGLLNGALAQNWCPPGAVWHYTVNNSYTNYERGLLQVECTNTVTINSVVCKHLRGTLIGSYLCPPTFNCPVNVYPWWFSCDTYENNNVVYVYNTVSSSFDTIADFNATIGDQWRITEYSPYGNSCPSTTPRTLFTVADTGWVTINNSQLKTLTLSTTSPLGTFTLSVTEKVLYAPGFLFPYMMCQVDGPTFGSFICYRDDNFPAYNPSSVSCDYVAIGIPEQRPTDKSLTLYPNPNNGSFQLELTDNTYLKILNTIGVSVYESRFNSAGSKEVDVSDLPPGIYHIQTESPKGKSYSKFTKY